MIGKHITEGVDFEPTILNVLKPGKGMLTGNTGWKARKERFIL